MIPWDRFAETLARHARRDRVEPGDVLFGEGLDLSSIGYTEFILDLEEDHDLDIDLEALDASIRTAGELHAALGRQAGTA